MNQHDQAEESIPSIPGEVDDRLLTELQQRLSPAGEASPKTTERRAPFRNYAGRVLAAAGFVALSIVVIDYAIERIDSPVIDDDHPTPDINLIPNAPVPVPTPGD